MIENLTKHNAIKIKGFSVEQLQKLNDYFQLNLGINLDQVPGLETVLKRDLKVTIAVNPERYHYTIWYPIKMKAGTKIKIVDFNNIEPLGYTNHLIMELVNPQVELHEINGRLEDVIEAIK
jgi:hypothetical protein